MERFNSASAKWSSWYMDSDGFKSSRYCNVSIVVPKGTKQFKQYVSIAQTQCDGGNGVTYPHAKVIVRHLEETQDHWNIYITQTVYHQDCDSETFSCGGDLDFVPESVVEYLEWDVV